MERPIFSMMVTFSYVGHAGASTVMWDCFITCCSTFPLCGGLQRVLSRSGSRSGKFQHSGPRGKSIVQCILRSARDHGDELPSNQEVISVLPQSFNQLDYTSNFLAVALLAEEWNLKYLVWGPDPWLWGQSTHSHTSRGEVGEKEMEDALSFSQLREKLMQLSHKRRQGDWCNGCVIIFEQQHPVGWGQGSQLNTQAHRFVYHEFIRLIAVAIKAITAFREKRKEHRQPIPGETLEREKYNKEGRDIWSSKGYKNL